VAEQIPGQIKKLIYLAGFVPANGESLLSLSQSDLDSHIGKYLQIVQNEGKASIAKEGIVDVFAADADQMVADHLTATFKAEPLAPFAAPIALTDANFGSVKKVYIQTIDDHAISYGFQLKMAAKAGIVTTYALPSSHTPFLVMPGVVAAIIGQEAN
jgi:hypothetical protein